MKILLLMTASAMMGGCVSVSQFRKHIKNQDVFNNAAVDLLDSMSTNVVKQRKEIADLKQRVMLLEFAHIEDVAADDVSKLKPK